MLFCLWEAALHWSNFRGSFGAAGSGLGLKMRFIFPLVALTISLSAPAMAKSLSRCEMDMIIYERQLLGGIDTNYMFERLYENFTLEYKGLPAGENPERYARDVIGLFYYYEGKIRAANFGDKGALMEKRLSSMKNICIKATLKM